MITTIILMGLKRWAIVGLMGAGTVAMADFDAEAFPPHERCALCHGLWGQSHTAKFPHLAGQDPIYLTQQIESFLAETRTNDGGQMVAIVQELLEGDLPKVVGWFSTQPAPEPEAGEAETVALGKTLFETANCGACHGEMPGIPLLTAQHPGYLAKQMRDFRDGRRVALDGSIPHGTLIPSEDAKIDALSSFLASEPRK